MKATNLPAGAPPSRRILSPSEYPCQQTCPDVEDDPSAVVGILLDPSTSAERYALADFLHDDCFGLRVATRRAVPAEVRIVRRGGSWRSVPGSRALIVKR